MPEASPASTTKQDSVVDFALELLALADESQSPFRLSGIEVGPDQVVPRREEEPRVAPGIDVWKGPSQHRMAPIGIARISESYGPLDLSSSHEVHFFQLPVRPHGFPVRFDGAIEPAPVDVQRGGLLVEARSDLGIAGAPGEIAVGRGKAFSASRKQP